MNDQAAKPLLDPVCAMPVNAEQAQFQHTYQDHHYYFCSEHCRRRFADQPQDYQHARDPVCGMQVRRDRPAAVASHDGQRYYFCSSRCEQRFNAAPADFLGEQSRQQAMPAGTQYTCPMHPEIVRDEPGDCPKCGMALEPTGIPPADAGPNPELVDFQRRFWLGAVLTVPLLVLSMGAHVGVPVHDWLSVTTNHLVQWLLSTPLVLWCGWPFFKRAWQSLVNRSLNMFTLIGMGTATAYLYSVVAVLAPAIFPAELQGAHGAIDVYFEAAGVIIVLVLLGQVLELRARERTGDAIRALLDLSPKQALRLNDDGESETIDLEQVQVGDRLRVRPGEAVPVDGEVLEGRSRVDESLLSGEPVPVAKNPGDSVTAGTINDSGSLIMRAQRVGTETTLARIVDLVAAAQRSRAPLQQLADRVAGWFVPLVVAAAMVAFALWLVFGPPPALSPCS